MSNTAAGSIKLFQFPRMFSIPNLSPFCCKLETWLRITGIPYEVVDTPDPRSAPKGKLPFIEDGGVRMGDTSLIIEHLRETRGVDPDAHLDPSQHAIARLVRRLADELRIPHDQLLPYGQELLEAVRGFLSVKEPGSSQAALERAPEELLKLHKAANLYAEAIGAMPRWLCSLVEGGLPRKFPAPPLGFVLAPSLSIGR